jgi:hypothetical protein
LNFGLVAPGVTKDLPIIITNDGVNAADTCSLSAIDLAVGSNAAYSIVGGPIAHVDLQAGQVLRVVVRVAPTGATPATLQSVTGTLTFTANSATAPQASIALTTLVGTNCVAVTPDPLDFGTVQLGCSAPERTLTLYNVCTASLTINSFTMQNPAGLPFGHGCTTVGGCPEFTLTQAPSVPTGGLAMAPGASPLTFRARYHPLDVGVDSGAVAINVTQNGQPVTYLVALSGRGEQVGLQTDTFLQSQQSKADILLVVDDSGSMSDKQQSLANNFTSFIQAATAGNVDYHIGVTTTTSDCSANSGCLGSVAAGGALALDATTSVRYITPQTPGVASVFSRLVRVGVNGAGVEMGLEGAVAALTPPRVANENAGFLRSDASLSVVVITDASDQSPQPVSYYQDRLVNVKGVGQLSKFTFSNIGPYGPVPSPTAPCLYDQDSDPSRYQAIVTATSGVTDEICSANWSAMLLTLGRTAAGFRTEFYLRNTPDLTAGHPLTVKVNGVVVPSGSSTWTYDNAANSINFTPTSTPPPGQALEVTYSTICN